MNRKLWLVIPVLIGGSMIIKKRYPLGIRNNNGGNIRATGKWRAWQGAIGENKGFIVFDTPENGLRALARTLRTYKNNYGFDTIEEIISRWAPPNENDTESYIKSVATSAGLSRDSFVADAFYPVIMAAIVHHENGQQPYSNEQIQNGFIQGFA